MSDVDQLETTIESLYSDVFHIGIDSCGHVAFQYRRDGLESGAPIYSSLLVWPDGRQARTGEQIRCHHCKRPVDLVVDSQLVSGHAETLPMFVRH